MHVIRKRRMLLLDVTSLPADVRFRIAMLGTHTSALEVVSNDSLRFSKEVPKVPSFLRAVAVTRDASGPPFGCLVFLSCSSIGSMFLVVELHLHNTVIQCSPSAAAAAASARLYHRQHIVCRLLCLFVVSEPSVRIGSQPEGILFGRYLLPSRVVQPPAFL